MGKSIVSMERNQCPICGSLFETNGLILQTKNLKKPKLERYTVTGMSICPDCQPLIDADMVALVEVDNPPVGEKLTLGEAKRTGVLIFMSKSLAIKMLGHDIDEMAFIGKGVADKIRAIAPLLVFEEPTITEEQG